MKIYLVGAFDSVHDEQSRKQNLYEKTIKECLGEVELVLPREINQYRKQCEKQNPEASRVELDKMMVDFENKHLHESDLVICDLSTSTIAMGIDLGIAYENSKEVLFFYEFKPHLSSRVTGLFPNSTFNVYKTLDELTKELTNALKQYKK